jgi:hypothetical protein
MLYVQTTLPSPSGHRTNVTLERGGAYWGNLQARGRKKKKKKKRKPDDKIGKTERERGGCQCPIRSLCVR